MSNAVEQERHPIDKACLIGQFLGASAYQGR